MEFCRLDSEGLLAFQKPVTKGTEISVVLVLFGLFPSFNVIESNTTRTPQKGASAVVAEPKQKRKVS